jgi:hypothetical protein
MLEITYKDMYLFFDRWLRLDTWQRWVLSDFIIWVSFLPICMQDVLILRSFINSRSLSFPFDVKHDVILAPFRSFVSSRIWKLPIWYYLMKNKCESLLEWSVDLSQVVQISRSRCISFLIVGYAKNLKVTYKVLLDEKWMCIATRMVCRSFSGRSDFQITLYLLFDCWLRQESESYL